MCCRLLPTLHCNILTTFAKRFSGDLSIHLKNTNNTCPILSPIHYCGYQWVNVYEGLWLPHESIENLSNALKWHLLVSFKCWDSSKHINKWKWYRKVKEENTCGSTVWLLNEHQTQTCGWHLYKICWGDKPCSFKRYQSNLVTWDRQKSFVEEKASTCDRGCSGRLPIACLRKREEVRSIKRVGLGKVGDNPPKTALQDITNLGKVWLNQHI